MASAKLRIGLIGCGGIAPAHLTCYQQNAHAEVVAVADIRPTAAEGLAAKAGARAYTDHGRMLEAENLDGVSLLTPPSSHREIAERALAAGLHVLCEKPMAGSAADGRAMAEAAQRAGKLLLVAQCHRFHEPVRRA
ncbi:MAG: Gfo/Idh/MocA family oxidoreductase, partial [Gemmatimonadota bacterium]